MKNKKIYFTFALLLGIITFLIAINTPSSGDDWYYELFYRNENIFLKMFERYFTTQPRIFAWITTAFLAGNRWLWNLVLPCVFVGIYGCLVQFAKKEHKKTFMIGLLTFCFIIIVSATTKQSNYFWLSGSTYYLFPSLMLLIYILIVFQILFNKLKIKPILMFIGAVVIGFFQVNAAVSVFITLFLATVFDYYKHKKINPMFLWGMIGCLIVLLLSYISPGAQLRMMNDNPEISNMPLWGRFKYAFPEMLRITFIPLAFPIFIYCLSMSYIGIRSYLQAGYNLVKVGFTFANLLITLFYLILILIVFLNLQIPIVQPIFDSLMNGSYFYSYKTILFTLFAFIIILSPYIFIDDETLRFKLSSLVLSAAAANFVLVLSPVQDERISIFAMFLLSAAAIMLFSSLNTNLLNDRCLAIFILVLLMSQLGKWSSETKTVRQVTKCRIAEIQGYRESGYPSNTPLQLASYAGIIQGADVQSGSVGDEGHYKKFVELFNLPSNVTIEVYDLKFYQKLKPNKCD